MCSTYDSKLLIKLRFGFCSHNSETTHWLDPRLSTNKKMSPLECEDNGESLEKPPLKKDSIWLSVLSFPFVHSLYWIKLDAAVHSMKCLPLDCFSFPEFALVIWLVFGYTIVELGRYCLMLWCTGAVFRICQPYHSHQLFVSAPCIGWSIWSSSVVGKPFAPQHFV